MGEKAQDRAHLRSNTRPGADKRLHACAQVEEGSPRGSRHGAGNPAQGLEDRARLQQGRSAISSRRKSRLAQGVSCRFSSDARPRSARSSALSNVRLGSKAEVAAQVRNVCFWARSEVRVSQLEDANRADQKRVGCLHVCQRRSRVAGIPLAGSRVICGLMPITASGSRVNRYLCPTAARMIAASIKAKLLPTHNRCPPPNG
jgi:hypothetical protein